MLFVGRESGGGAGFCWGAPLSHMDQSGCSRKKFAEILGDSEFVRQYAATVQWETPSAMRQSAYRPDASIDCK
jgi:hypothetical protein